MGRHLSPPVPALAVGAPLSPGTPATADQKHPLVSHVYSHGQSLDFTSIRSGGFSRVVRVSGRRILLE